MTMTYEEISAFMEEYFPAYSECGQDPEKYQRMNDFYAPDFVFTGYVGYSEPVVYQGREAFLRFDISHPSSFERLTPLAMTIDERNETVFVVIKFDFIDTSTGQVLVVEYGATRYELVRDETGSIKIKSFVFFPQRVMPGVLTGAEVFRRDAGKV
jgi:hypothetical protein